MGGTLRSESQSENKWRCACDEWGRAFLLGEGLALSGTAVVALGLNDVAVLALGAGLVALGGDQALVASLAVCIYMDFWGGVHGGGVRLVSWKF